MTDHPTPARTLYTAQEIADLALKWGAAATLTQDDDDVVIDLERGNESMQLTFGSPHEFYSDVICRSWVFIESAPHRACDRWNEFPYFATFSVVYDDYDVPMTCEYGFVVRGVQLIEFERATSEDDIMMQILLFWFAMSLIQGHVASGSTDLSEIDRLKIPGEAMRWWLGDDAGGGTGDDDNADDDASGDSNEGA